MIISFQSRDLSLDYFKQELINADRSSVYYPLNAIDIAMQPKVNNIEWAPLMENANPLKNDFSFSVFFNPLFTSSCVQSGLWGFYST